MQSLTLFGMVTNGPRPNDARHRISCNIRAQRKARGLSQEQLAELANFHRTYVSQLERCVTNISIDGLQRLAAALEVDIVDLLRHDRADAA